MYVMTFVSNQIDGSTKFKATRNDLALKVIHNEQINSLIFLPFENVKSKFKWFN